jgi:hypothetical protein
MQNPPASRKYTISNWFTWMVQAHQDGFSDADIRFVLQTVGVMEAVQAAVQADNNRRQAKGGQQCQ